MNLFRESLDAVRWVRSVTRAFFDVRPTGYLGGPENG